MSGFSATGGQQFWPIASADVRSVKGNGIVVDGLWPRESLQSDSEELGDVQVCDKWLHNWFQITAKIRNAIEPHI